jgi:hypothetical protein
MLTCGGNWAPSWVFFKRTDGLAPPFVLNWPSVGWWKYEVVRTRCLILSVVI